LYSIPKKIFGCRLKFDFLKKFQILLFPPKNISNGNQAFMKLQAKIEMGFKVPYFSPYYEQVSLNYEDIWEVYHNYCIWRENAKQLFFVRNWNFIRYPLNILGTQFNSYSNTFLILNLIKRPEPYMWSLLTCTSRKTFLTPSCVVQIIGSIVVVSGINLIGTTSVTKGCIQWIPGWLMSSNSAPFL